MVFLDHFVSPRSSFGAEFHPTLGMWNITVNVSVEKQEKDTDFLTCVRILEKLSLLLNREEEGVMLV